MRGKVLTCLAKESILHWSNARHTRVLRTMGCLRWSWRSPRTAHGASDAGPPARTRRAIEKR